MKDKIQIKPTISNAIRLGKKGFDKPRLLKITVSSIEEKVVILWNKVKIRADSNPEYVRKMFIIITPDLTPLEQLRKNKVLKQQ